jgi:hypothetical protein
MTSIPPKKPRSGGRVQVHLPSDLEPTYSNFALITHSRSEIVIDFAQILPQVPRATVRQRIVLTALNAKLLWRALGDHLARFESVHGEIVVPEGTSLADQLFRPHTGDDDDDAEDDKS